jgi:uncharacterized protein YbjT (DUF2867 family)
MATSSRVLITGGGTFLGDSIALALLQDGADVTVLMRPDAEVRIPAIRQQARILTADLWNPASLRGRSRGHAIVVHTVGSMVEDRATGDTYHKLNFVSARNAANMAMSDGAGRFILISAASAPWISRGYRRSKREAERFLREIGIAHAVVRAPLVYLRGRQRPWLFSLISYLGARPPLRWSPLGQVAPIPMDVLARGVARVAAEPAEGKTIYDARDLRRMNTLDEIAGLVPLLTASPTEAAKSAAVLDYIGESAEFGWLPPR